MKIADEIENKAIKAIKNFKVFYITLLRLNPETGLQLKEIIPASIINEMEEVLKLNGVNDEDSR